MSRQLPFAFAPRPCTPRSSTARRSLLPGSFRHASCVYRCPAKLNLERCKWNHRAARAWASWPTWRASPEGGGRSSINFSEVCGPPAEPTSSRQWRQAPGAQHTRRRLHLRHSSRTSKLPDVSMWTGRSAKSRREKPSCARRDAAQVVRATYGLEGTQLGLAARSFTVPWWARAHQLLHRNRNTCTPGARPGRMRGVVGPRVVD